MLTHFDMRSVSFNWQQTDSRLTIDWQHSFNWQYTDNTLTTDWIWPHQVCCQCIASCCQCIVRSSDNTLTIISNVSGIRGFSTRILIVKQVGLSEPVRILSESDVYKTSSWNQLGGYNYYRHWAENSSFNKLAL